MRQGNTTPPLVQHGNQHFRPSSFVLDLSNNIEFFGRKDERTKDERTKGRKDEEMKGRREKKIKRKEVDDERYEKINKALPTNEITGNIS